MNLKALLGINPPSLKTTRAGVEQTENAQFTNNTMLHNGCCPQKFGPDERSGMHQEPDRWQFSRLACSTVFKEIKLGLQKPIPKTFRISLLSLGR